MCSSGNTLYSAALVSGFLCLVGIDVRSMSIVSTRPLSTISLEEILTVKIGAGRAAPDGQVLFVLDQGLGRLMRVESGTGNCSRFDLDTCKFVFKF